VVVEGARVKPGHKLRAGETVTVTLRPAAPARAEAQPIALEVLFEDAHLIVVNKPPGLVVHPAPGHPDGTLVNALLHHCDDLSGIGGELRPGIVHRLDKDTSGIIIASKDDATHHALAALFKDKTRIVREYLAVVAPAPRTGGGVFDTLYGRHPVHRKKFSSKVTRGKRALTHWTVEERFGEGAALVRCRLETGRTHQIRVHFADHGTPLLADPVYGRKPRDPALAALAAALGRQALHATRLELPHPVTGARLRFESPPPPDLRELIESLRVLQEGR
jgi:23S rRNA pseudouridine1911/1915/1917 synthase